MPSSNTNKSAEFYCFLPFMDSTASVIILDSEPETSMYSVLVKQFSRPYHIMFPKEPKRLATNGILCKNASRRQRTDQRQYLQQLRGFRLR